ncbi:hypothetical protein VMCG_05307 [Cytospora schulzeri]|uniref:Sequence orphan n=1 Tax=Cytospora schulzeri TaxID=448051 RepID=A0A423WQM3_9PEZI|nr:hypothetical protein VMCG_05307 [Valsa malicola]
MDTASRLETKWNTKNLLSRLAADFVSAASAAALVAPLISIIDRSIMENASGRANLGVSIKNSLRNLLLRPHTMLFSRPVALIFMVYGGTYLTANALDTATSTVQNKAPTLVTSGTAKFASSSAANIGLGIYKDQVYARLFGPVGKAVRAVPASSYVLFTLRDCMTIFAGFNLPMIMGPRVGEMMGDEMRRQVSGQTMVQFAAPAVVQIASTPVHLLGLDLYNRPRSLATGLPSLRERWAQVYKNWGVSVVARLCRIIPAYGVGGVVNSKPALAGVDVILPELEALDALLPTEHAALLGHLQLLLGHPDAPAEPLCRLAGRHAAAELAPVPRHVPAPHPLGRHVVQVPHPGQDGLDGGLVGAVLALDHHDAALPEGAQPHGEPELAPQPGRLLEVHGAHELDAAARPVEHGPQVDQADDAAGPPEHAPRVVGEELGQVPRQLREVEGLVAAGAAAAADNVLGRHQAELACRLGQQRVGLGRAGAPVGRLPGEALGQGDNLPGRCHQGL